MLNVVQNAESHTSLRWCNIHSKGIIKHLQRLLFASNGWFNVCLTIGHKCIIEILVQLDYSKLIQGVLTC